MTMDITLLLGGYHSFRGSRLLYSGRTSNIVVRHVSKFYIITRLCTYITFKFVQSRHDIEFQFQYIQAPRIHERGFLIVSLSPSDELKTYTLFFYMKRTTDKIMIVTIIIQMCT